MSVQRMMVALTEFKRLSTTAAATLSLSLIATFLTVVPAGAQPANGANKFLGNITQRGQVRSDYLKYWNQITPENESKWGSVEGSRDRMNWGGVDRVADFAKQNNIPWKFHTLIWGSQYPGWITGLSQSEQLAEIEEWMDAAAERYPDVDMIDVINEAYESNGGRHAPPPFKNALGGTGSTGFDWFVNAFKMARERWPKAILIYNDYNTIEWNNEVNWQVKMAQAMKDANAPMDAIGVQAHDAWRVATRSVKSNLDKIAAVGYPIVVSEYDIGQNDDNAQKRVMEEQFTMFWNHPKILGVTYWGYVVGQTWRNGTGLMQSSGAERPALTWLVDFVKKNPDPPNDFPDMLNGDVGINRPAPLTMQSSFTGSNPRIVQVFDLQGRAIASSVIAGRTAPVSSIVSSSGSYIVKINNGCRTINSIH